MRRNGTVGRGVSTTGLIMVTEYGIDCRDRKTKKFVGQANDDPSKKKIRTEDGKIR